MNKLNAYKSLIIWLVIGVMMIALFNLLNVPKKGEEELIFSDFMTKLEAGQVEDVTIKGSIINGQLKDGKKFRTFSAEYPDLVRLVAGPECKDYG